MPRLSPLLLAFFCLPAIAGAAEPIRYAVRFPAPQTHYAEVEADVPTDGRPDVELMMPVWTPGSYLVREFARHVEAVAAKGPDGKPLAVEKSRKNRWKVATGGAPRVTVSYRVYGREMGVQTNWIDAGFALLNGAPTFLTLADGGARPHEVALAPPPGWLKSFCALPSPAAHRFVAPDYDSLVDSPIYAGNPAVYEFTVDGKPHFLVNEGENGIWDGPKAAKDVEAIVRAQRAFWGSLPYDQYIFFNMLTESSGGLEHKASTVLMASRWATRRRADYLGWLKLVSHEFFHTWNVKRMRPVELGPFDYENEVVTKSLWIAEGLTSYYGDLLVRRAGLCTSDEYLAGRAVGAAGEGDTAKGDIQNLQDTPGRGVQPLESASADTWIKFYRRDENTPNTAISYYTKGSVVGFLLDAEIRRATKGARSLDDAMRLAYARFSGARGYTPAEFRAVAAEVAGTDLAPFFHRALETTDELDYAAALQWQGLRFAPEPAPKEGKPVKAWLGLETKAELGRLNVSVVKRDTPGYAAGFNVGDEIVAIGDDRVLPEQWSRRMEQYLPNEKASILVARRGRLLRLDATFGREPAPRFKLEPDPAATDEQKAHRRAWLGE
ncbi:M61 family metallopeptidase [Tundrisphaera sp. TA3]|uniref:M61 family metallopeptidase n=1 Tax=Tundrisphaera sp. TA3 TaxID=3435775 RepID=UPI003EBFEC23